MKNIVVLGLGKVGTLVGVLLSKKFNVTGIDQKNHTMISSYHLKFLSVMLKMKRSRKKFQK